MISLRAFDSGMASKHRLDNRKIDNVESAVYLIRGQRVMLDWDPAGIYGVTTKRLDEQLKRNYSRFQEDFAFQLIAQEFTNLRSQIETLKGRGGRRYLPWAFTEYSSVEAAVPAALARNLAGGTPATTVV
jgi:hypothetical protein